MHKPDIHIQPGPGGTLRVRAPFHPAFPKLAAGLGGKKAGPPQPAWVFDARDEERVRAACRQVYGTDGSPEDLRDCLTVRVLLTPEEADAQDFWALGRRLAYRYEKDSSVSLGEGVVLAPGSARFPAVAGSRKAPVLGHDFVVLEVRDVPQALARRALEEQPQRYALPGQPFAGPQEARRAHLHTKLRRLRAQVEEVEAELRGLEAPPEGRNQSAATTRRCKPSMD